MAMSCFASPLLGRPTRRARLSSASVDSGMSEKSIALSEIGLTLFAARLPCADEPDGFFAILQSPKCINYNQHPALQRNTQKFESPFPV